MLRFSAFVRPVLAAGLGLFCLGAGPVRADDPSSLTIGAGAWEVMRNSRTEPELDLTYRSDYKLWIFKPQAGALVAGDGDYFGFGGLYTDIYFGRHVVLTPSLNVGLFNGHGIDLGSRVEFREGAELAWRFDNAYRLGAAFYHISNSDLTKRNPGSESVLLTLSVPIDSLLSGFGTASGGSSRPAVAAAGTGAGSGSDYSYSSPNMAEARLY